MAVHKKNEEKSTLKVSDAKEEIVASDVVIKTTGNIEIIEETPESVPSTNPLSDFKEKMNMEEQSPSQTATRKNFMWPILFIFIAAIVLLTGIFVYKQGMFKSVKIHVAVPTPTPTAIPEPTKAPDLTKFEIEILNGSSVDGEASAQKLNLTAAGFTVSSVGNADNSNYTDTVIRAKKEVDSAFLDKLKTTLENSFTAVTQEVLPDTSSVPVVVVLGTKK